MHISVCIFHPTYSEKYILKTKKMTIQIYFCFLKCKLTNKRKLSLFSFKHNSYNSIFLCCIYIAVVHILTPLLCVYISLLYCLLFKCYIFVPNIFLSTNRNYEDVGYKRVRDPLQPFLAPKNFIGAPKKI